MNNEIIISPYETPWEIASKIINAKCEVALLGSQKYLTSAFTFDDLRKIGEHIVNYCNAEQRKVGANNGNTEKDN